MYSQQVGIMNVDDLDVTPRKLLPHLYHIKHTDPGARRRGLSTNTYVLTNNDTALLIDAGFKYLMGPVNEILSQGLTLAGALYTHRHLVANGNILGLLDSEFDVPLFLHPLDQENPWIRSLSYSFENPINHPLINKFDVEVIHFPGHTEGSVLLYQQSNGGLIISGDAAMGPSEKEIKDGKNKLVRPPENTCVDDKQLRMQWEQFDHPFSLFAPYHGGIIKSNPEASDEFLSTLQREEPTKEL